MAEKDKDPLRRDLTKAKDFAKGFLGGATPKPVAPQPTLPEKKDNLQYNNKKQRGWGSSW